MTLNLRNGVKKNGFSIIEIFAVVFIVGLLASIGFINYQEARGNLALNRAAHQLLQDLRKTQEMAMSARDFDANNCVPPSASLHFASLSHLALGGVFKVFCSSEIYGSNDDRIKYIATTVNAPGYLSYSWSGYASGCNDSFHCEKEIEVPELLYDAQVTVTAENGQTLSTTCAPLLVPIGGVGDSWHLILGDNLEEIYYYGVYINIGDGGSDTSYKLYIDRDGDTAGNEIGYNDALTDCVVATIDIAEQGVIIYEINNLDQGESGRFDTSIGFAPPNPIVNIAGLDPTYDAVEIVLALENDHTKQRTISVNTAGLLEMK